MKINFLAGAGAGMLFQLALNKAIPEQYDCFVIVLAVIMLSWTVLFPPHAKR